MAALLDFLLKDFDGFLKLGVLALGQVIGSNVDNDVGDCPVEFHVFPVVREKPPATGEAHAAEAEDVGRARRDDSAGGWDSDDFSTIETLDGVGKDLGIGEGVLIANDHDRLVPAGVNVSILGVTDSAIAPDGVSVQGLGENSEAVIGGEAASVVANVDDESVFARSPFVNVMFKFLEFVPHHAGNVEIAQFPFGGCFDGLVTMIKMGGVGEGAGLPVADGADGDVARFFLILAFHREDDVAVEASVEEAGQRDVRAEVLSVNPGDEVTRF